MAQETEKKQVIDIRPPVVPEVPRTPETKQEVEKQPEAARETKPEPVPEATPPEPAQPVAAAPAPTTPPAKDKLTQQIESVLSEDLTDLFLKLPPNEQEAFKQKGEETAGKIRQMLSSAKVNATKIFELIKDWLKLLPGANKYYLEQEAKIKTDKLLIYAHDAQQGQENQIA